MVTRFAVTATAAVTLLCSSCTQLLGIEDAHVDPALTESTNGPDGGKGGAASAGAGGAGGGSGDNAPGGSGTTGGGTAGHPGEDATGGGAGAAAVDGSDGGSAVCRQYCDDIMNFCTGNVKQYLDGVQCLKICALFPEGVVGGPDGNTASCRMKYAANARYAAGTERDAYCRKAGPGSDGTCGSICDGFCTMMMPTCTQARTAPYFYPSLDACLTSCRSLRDDPPYTVSDGTLPDTNDVQCRLFHASSAVMDPDEHCEHAMGVTMCNPKDAGADH